MAIATMDALVDGLTTGQLLPIYKPAVTTVAGSFHSLWTAAGTPGAGSTPSTGSGQVCTRTTVGAIPYINATSGELSYLARALVNGSAAGTLIIYDRLVTTSGLSGTTLGTQNINSSALTRYTSGQGVQAFVEWYSATGATAANITLNYTNEAGTTGQVTAATPFIPSAAAGRMMPIPLNGNDGIRVAESISLSASTGTAGNFGITLMRRLLSVSISGTGAATTLDAFATGLAQLPDDTCLAMMFWAPSTSSGVIHGEISLAQG